MGAIKFADVNGELLSAQRRSPDIPLEYFHNRIYKALIERDAEQASRLMKEHLSGALAFIKKKASEKELC